MTDPCGAELNPLVRKLESIAVLSDDEREAIESLPVVKRVLSPRQDIARDRDRPTSCCLVLEGWVFSYKILDDGKRQIVAFYLPGDIPDLQSLHLLWLDHSLATLTTCTLAFIDHEDLRGLLGRFPRVAGALWRDTLVAGSIFREWLTRIGRRSAYSRVAHLFCELYIRLEAIGLAEDYRCELPVTQLDLSDALGLSPVHFNRVLQALRRWDLIDLRDRTLIIPDWRALSRVAKFDPNYLHLKKRASG